jgi:hypothetical protein
VTPWWPWHDSGGSSPPSGPAGDIPVGLTPRGELFVLRARVDQVDAMLRDAVLAARDGKVPVDVLLDINRTLHPVNLRPAVPVIPGPESA